MFHLYKRQEVLGILKPEHIENEQQDIRAYIYKVRKLTLLY